VQFTHRGFPGRRVRLGYCLNVHPAEDLDGVLGGLRQVSAPLRDRLGAGEAFGVGLYLPAAVVEPLARPAGRRDLDRLRGELREGGFDPFTLNAFPYGGFHRPGLKAGVSRPRWDEDARVEYTLAAAQVAAELAGPDRGHLSISTHAGAHTSDALGADFEARTAANLGRVARELRRIEARGGPRVVLSVEPEPRSAANDSEQWSRAYPQLRAAAARSVGLDESAVARHLGLCLDACHAAVEFEPAEAACARAATSGAPLGKFQFSSALRLADPATDRRGAERLLSLDEPVYLHQVTARTADGTLLRAADLPELRDPARRAAFDRAREWRCHFHVPVDLAVPLRDGGGLRTTAELADGLLARLLAEPSAWGLEELHLEIETYTWSVLPAEARGPGALVDGLEREYRHVLAGLAAAGWTRA
jgi:hypothetical protein